MILLIIFSKELIVMLIIKQNRIINSIIYCVTIMKKIFIILIISTLYNQYSYSQNKINLLSDAEFEKIKINDIPLQKIIDTRGNYSKLKSMFGNDLKYKTYEKSFEVVEYWNNKIIARFEEDDRVLTYLKLHFPNTITIKGIKVKIGDDIRLLGLVKVDTTEGAYSVYFNDEETLTASVTIQANPITKKIIEIDYILF
jgi:hypothetical protein